MKSATLYQAEPGGANLKAAQDFAKNLKMNPGFDGR